jgi:transcriptional regulator with XRE-family HTH domain
MRLKSVFIQNLRKYRKYRDISQAALAEGCNTSTSYIGQIEIGNRFPSLEMIEKIAAVLKIKPHLLFFIQQDEDVDEQIPQIKTNSMSDAMKDELIKRLTDSIRRIVKNTN